MLLLIEYINILIIIRILYLFHKFEIFRPQTTGKNKPPPVDTLDYNTEIM